MDYSIRIGGEAGQGIQTIGDTLAHIFAEAGYYVFTSQDYESRIRGGHNSFYIRISDKPKEAMKARLEILLALDKDSITLHGPELSENGQILYDPSLFKQTLEGPRVLSIPFLDLALKHGGSKIMMNSVAIGSIVGMLKMQPEPMIETIQKTFGKKDTEVLEANVKCAKLGYEFALKECLKCSFSVSQVLKPNTLISGNEAIGIGACASGLKFYSGYPMTPSTGIFNFIAEYARDLGIVVEQAEDEISAINMIIGASFAGVRAMTATSGGGFCLMVEGLSLAAMTETPLVVVLAQRPGPATGLPTRTEAAELLFATFAGHGEFPRVIFAPGSPKQALYLTNKAFDLSEKYQILVLILTDQYLADSQWTYDSLDMERLKYVDYRLRGKNFRNILSYNRHSFTESGVSPLGVPGDAHHLIVTDSDEHDEEGHITEDPQIRTRMVEKRLFKKIPYIKREISPPIFFGENPPDTLVVCWGSMYGVVKEVVEELKQDLKLGMLHFSEIYPFPEEDGYLRYFEKAKKVVGVEQNALSQFEKLLGMEKGISFDARINKFDGRPFTVEELKERLIAVAK
ncbi:MAG: 2-oxoacid:acceptor oxidoreductase subunit alpha [Deltaproteobacteria bacterium]|nr:2-oxoacid:acceptor oxidoreductase subunit alpha [Deltaproteobacteria bacterium]